MADLDAALQTYIRNIENQTGMPFPAVLDAARASGHTKYKDLLAWAKAEWGLGHGYANHVAIEALNPKSDASGEDPIEALFAGKKAALRPRYDQIMATIAAFGSDIDVSPKRGYVSLRRTKQFAMIQPSTADRIDVGLVLKGTPPGDRLEAAGSFNTMMTHRIRITGNHEIEEAIGWIRTAYDAA